MAMPAETARRWSAREVRKLIADAPLATPCYELVDGELLVTPGPSPLHQRAVVELVVALSGYLKVQPVGYVLTSPSDVELEPEFVTQPDVYVLPMTEWRRILHEENIVRELLVAAEVLSPSSSRHDRVRKRTLYQRHVPNYWLVDLDARVIERCTPDDARPEILINSLTWHAAGAETAFMLDIPAYFQRVLDT